MVTFRYRGREIQPEDVLYVRTLIAQHPTGSRRKFSTRPRKAWDWRQSNGALRDMVCRGLLLMLERAGQIALPPVTYKRHNPLAQRSRPTPVLLDQTPIEATLKDLDPVEFEQVRRGAEEPLFNRLMEENHYLGYGPGSPGGRFQPVELQAGGPLDPGQGFDELSSDEVPGALVPAVNDPHQNTDPICVTSSVTDRPPPIALRP
jgi:hypothetical protein